MPVSVYRTPAGPAVEVTAAAGVVTALRPAPDGDHPWLAPAFFDLQVNGGFGVNFGAAHRTPGGLARVAAELRARGVGGFCPTLITDDLGELAAALRALERERAASPELARHAAGYHLEGPFISPEDGARGAHPREHVKRPDWAAFGRLQDAAGGNIRLVTLAPEQPGALPLIERLTASGVTVAIGHTLADAATIEAAAAAGARLCTHLGNGCPIQVHRHDNPLWPQLAHPRLSASVIADGHHLPPSVLRAIWQGKGAGRLILTCDASSLAGRPPGRYRAWGQDVDVEADGRVRLAGTPYLAGSGHFPDHCAKTAFRTLGLTVPDLVRVASTNPRRLLSLPTPTLEVGARLADFVTLTVDAGELNIDRA